MPGTITATKISGSLDAKHILIDVLTQAQNLGGISQIFRTVQVPQLTGTIPIVKPGSVAEDVEELEITDIETGDFLYVDFELKKDRVKLARSDEAKHRSNAGDPLAIQKMAAASELAKILDKKTITALQTAPQTSGTAGVWSTATNSPLADIGTAVAALEFPADFVIMPPAVFVKYLSTNAIQAIGTGNPAALKGAAATVPGYDLPIYVDKSGTITAKSALVGSAQGFGACIGVGPVEGREWDDPNAGGRVYQFDVFRQVKAPIFKTDANLNASVYQITGVIA
jgi:hypothetical protein